MARIRTIKPTHWSDKELPNISLQAHLFWIASWNFSDDKGVFENDPIFLKSQIFPRRLDITVEQIKEWCGELVSVRFIIPFNYEGVDYYVSRTFEDHQRIDKAQPSKVPSDIIRKAIEDHSKNVPRTVPPVLYSNSSVKEGKGKRKITPNGDGSLQLPEAPEDKAEYEEAKKSQKGLVAYIARRKPKDIEPYFLVWNMFAKKYSLAQVQKITDSRKRKFKVRIAENGFDFLKVLEVAGKSAFLKEGKWFGFDWILENDKNWLKVIEGNYDKNLDAPSTHGKSNPGAVVTPSQQFQKDLNYLIDRYAEGNFDAKIIEPEMYDRLITHNILSIGTMNKYPAPTIEGQKVLAVVGYLDIKVKQMQND